jgi:hypothetical protein
LLLGLLCLTTAWFFTRPDEGAATARPSPAVALQGEQAAEYLKQQGSYASLQVAINAKRYRVVPAGRTTPNAPSAEGGAYVARNPRQGFQTLFSTEQIQLTPYGDHSQTSSGKAPAWRLGLKLEGYGYGRQLSAVTPGVLKADANRIEIARGLKSREGIDGGTDSVLDTRHPALIEWYVNRGEGMEQGFTVMERPVVEPGDEPLRLRLELSGSLRARVNAGADEIALVNAEGEQVLSYDHLLVTDVEGRRLPSHFEVAEGALSIVVEDAGAAYPLTIDPTLTQQAYLKASNTEAGDFFGYSVAVSGDTVVVGTRREDSNATGVNGNQNDNSAVDSGAAYVFVRCGGTWSQQAYLKGHD